MNCRRCGTALDADRAETLLHLDIAWWDLCGPCAEAQVHPPATERPDRPTHPAARPEPSLPRDEHGVRHPSHLMTRVSAWLVTIAALVAWQTSPLCRAQGPTEGVEPPSVAIEGVEVVDVERGQIIGPRTVLVIKGRIAAIDEPGAVAVSAAAVRVDGRGHYLMPALVDMHVHLFNNASHRPPNDWTFPLFVANGVAAVREMNCEPADMPTLARWREAVARGDLLAPRVLAAGVPVRGDSLDAARQRVRDAHAAGADFMKVFSDVREPLWRAALAEAQAQGIPVCGHVPAAVSLLTAARAGQRSNEHLTQVYEACSGDEKPLVATRQGLNGREAASLRDAQERQVLEGFDPRVCDQTVAALAKTGQVQVPTLILPHFEARGARTGFRHDPRWHSLRADEQARWGMILDGEVAVDERLAAKRWEVSRKIVKAMHAAGVRILAGTDTPMPLVYPGSSLHKELELLVESGLSPAEALRAATLGAAEFFGLSESTGSVAVGKRADLVLLDDNPLRQIGNTQRIRAVVIDGRLLRRGDLDAMLGGSTSAPPCGSR